MKKIIIFTLSVLLTATSYAEELSFDEALSLAHKDEKSTKGESLTQLMRSQANYMGYAMPECINTTGKLPTDFSVVVRVNSIGNVEKSWLNTKDKFALCFEDLMKNNFQYKSDKQVFYTAIEYTVTVDE